MKAPRKGAWEAGKLFFEGSEKKLEVVVSERVGSLRALPREFWQNMVVAAGAQILSSVHNERCDAYLLSESSLFVWDRRFTMITCGRTTMPDALMHFMKTVPAADIESLIFERKNEYFPQWQPTDFFEDMRRIQAQLPGKARQFGKSDEHHLLVFSLEKPYRPDPADRTLEILMYDLQGEAKQIFTTAGQDREKLRQITALNHLLPDFKIDDHAFEPMGYSVNAIRGSEYYTVHVTPQETGSYVSFETNVHTPSFRDLVHDVLAIFQPRSVDLVQFGGGEGESWHLDGYQRRLYAEDDLTCGYRVSFSHHYVPTDKPEKSRLVEDLFGVHRESQAGGFVEEVHPAGFSVRYKTKAHLFDGKSDFQRVEVVETESHGRMLLNDGLVMVTELDEAIYHEMMAHVPLFLHPHPERVLIIGGGDGGTAREVLRHPSVKTCVMVEIDEMVVKACQEHIAKTSSVLGSDPRLRLLIADGVDFMEKTREQFDVILIDSTDPIGPATPLFGPEFYRNVDRCLSPGGIVISQGESPFYNSQMQQTLMGILSERFPVAAIYNFCNQTYPGGLWSFTYVSRDIHPFRNLSDERVEKSGFDFHYYNPSVHRAAFSLPEFMVKSVGRYFKGL